MFSIQLIKIINKTCAFYLTIYLIVLLIINNFELQYRPWTFLFTLIIVGINIILSTALIIKKIKSYKKRLVLTIIVSTLIIVFILLGIFSYRPEYVVTKNDRKMVAVVSNSLLDVEVYYYSYKGLVFMGDSVLVNEYYGSGSYDPFKIKPMPLPVRVDENH